MPAPQVNKILRYYNTSHHALTMVVFPEAGGPNITIFGTAEDKDLNVTTRYDRATSRACSALGVFISFLPQISFSASDTVVCNPGAQRCSHHGTYSLCLER